ncbi:hypothetical protein K439DRAFT_1620437 [Ramaria rubella]|nr:hypothetical protein K439DRAFT_1620437 [Ramaria rubella]
MVPSAGIMPAPVSPPDSLAKWLCNEEDELDEKTTTKKRHGGKKKGREKLSGAGGDNSQTGGKGGAKSQKGGGKRLKEEGSGDGGQGGSDDEGVGAHWSDDETLKLLEWLLGADNTEWYENFMVSPMHYFKKVHSPFKNHMD